MSKTYSRRDTLAVIASAAAFAPPVRAADFDWKRYNGIQLRFMVSMHPWTEWAQKQLPGLEAATGIKVNGKSSMKISFRQKLPLTLRSDPGAGRWILHAAVVGTLPPFRAQSGTSRSIRSSNRT